MESQDLVGDDNFVIAGRRAERLAQHGATVVGISQQAGAAGLCSLWLLVTVTSASRSTTLVWFLLTVAGAGVAFTSWIRARQLHTLLPYTIEAPERPFQVLDKAQRRTIGRQIRGKETVTPVTARLVRATHLSQRRSTRAALPPLIGMGLGVAGFAGSLIRTVGGWGSALLVLELATAVAVTIAGLVEANRRNRVLAATEHLETL
ncbi:hypothetical protein DEI81_12070 [Curtobacterium sp. MCBD17_013]|uniref:hypothetical protein n=1 Tax=Curtobacterium sp. MCBD17_013 TaxID=2175668 RepID=UPI000DA967F3|nr:hypothetical protein [Curtobacterium sp. MCBD17_013]PZF60731.1 hypothetical protein DEI81_12070 [Curtobacterium sp. MCBD17_013]